MRVMGKWIIPKHLFSRYNRVVQDQRAVSSYGGFRAAKMNNAVSPKTFTDQLQISDWALKAVQIVSTNTDIIAGYPDGSFRPQATATRAEAVIIILKALQL